MIGSINDIYEKGELPISLRLGIVALIPKGNKDQCYFSNWRPLTLLETLHKLISSILANRLKPVLEKIIGNEQMAYIPGRYISECTRNTYDIFTYAEENNLPWMGPGGVLCIGCCVFEKRFQINLLMWFCLLAKVYEVIWPKKIEKKLLLDTPAAPSIFKSFYIGSSLNFYGKLTKNFKMQLFDQKSSYNNI